jgi:hypothetical protein
MPNIDEAIEALLSYQQADMEGVMVLTSRQAIHEVADELKRVRSHAQDASDWNAATAASGSTSKIRRTLRYMLRVTTTPSRSTRHIVLTAAGKADPRQLAPKQAHSAVRKNSSGKLG